MEKIPGYEDNYEISNFGNIRSLERFTNGKHIPSKNMHPFNKGGRMSVVLRKVGSKPQYFVLPRLVLITFVGSPAFGQLACHKDGNPQNNCLDNLYWGSYKENSKDLFLSDTAKQAKLSIAQVKEIKEKLKSNSSRGAITKLEKEYNVGRGTVWDIAKGKTWKWVK